MAPYDKDVVNEPPPAVRGQGLARKKVLLQPTHEQISIGGGHTSPHRCAPNLVVELVTESEVIVCQNEVSEM